VSLTDWVISLHLLSAAALVGGLTAVWSLVLATRGGPEGVPGAVPAAIARPAAVAVGVGTLGTIIFGVWLAIDLDAYQLWDLWIVASLVLWLVGSALGSRAGAAFEKVAARVPDAVDWRRRGVLLQAGASVAFLLILVLMIWKPGA
jgi:hypothetical protein